MTRYSTALSYIVLAVTGIYCYLWTTELSFSQYSFGSIIANSIIGVWRWGNPSYGLSSDKLYKLTSLLQDLLALPCIVTTVWFQYGHQRNIAYVYLLVSGLIFIFHICDKKNRRDDLLNTVLGVNCITLGILSFIHQNYYGVAACLSYAFNHFVRINESEIYSNVPTQDLYNYAMCFFTFFARKTILD